MSLMFETDYSIDELCAMEDEGVIFAKFGKAKNTNNLITHQLRA